METSFPFLKPNVVPSYPTDPYHVCMIRVKKAKLDYVKSPTKHLRQSTIEYINSIREEHGIADDVFGGDDNEEDD